MRIRILKPIISILGSFKPGDVANIPENVAEDWCNRRLAMQDKSLDGSKEKKER